MLSYLVFQHIPVPRGEAVIRPYEPHIPENISDYADALQIFAAIENEIQLQPEYFYSYLEEDTSITCPFGGSFTFGPGDAGEKYTFENCAYDYAAVLFNITAEVSGEKSGALTYTHDYNNDSISVTGEYGSETVDLQD